MDPLEFIYYLGYSVEKSRKLKNRKRLSRKVISLGNLTLGGTGKTPAAMAVASEALKRGLKPCILTRGYGGKAKGPCFVSKGSGVLFSADDAGDEAFLMAKRLRGVSIVKCKNRYDGGIFALRHFQSEAPDSIPQILFILDDGFQHWGLERDRDVLLIDGMKPFGNRKLFPSGILREPLHEMKRADMIVLTKISPEPYRHVDITALTDEVRRYNGNAPIYLSEHRSICLSSASSKELPVETLSGKRIFSFCGIANPSSFRESLLRAGADIKGHMIFRDHHRYSGGDLRRILDGAKEFDVHWIVTTEKDIIKLSKFGAVENLLALRIELKLEKSFYDALFREE